MKVFTKDLKELLDNSIKKFEDSSKFKLGDNNKNFFYEFSKKLETSTGYSLNSDTLYKNLYLKLRKTNSLTHGYSWDYLNALAKYCHEKEYLDIYDTTEERSNQVDTRSFEWYKQRGMLINHSDAKRMIAFSNETFVNILDGVCNGVLACPSNEDTDNEIEKIKLANSILYNSGYYSGTEAGWEFKEYLQKNKEKLQLAERINHWCQFTSDNGFGNMYVMNKEGSRNAIDHIENGGISFNLIIEDSITVYRRTMTQISLCNFITGYIRGNLEGITGHPLEISHTLENCSQFMAHIESCIFELKTDFSKMEEQIQKVKSTLIQ